MLTFEEWRHTYADVFATDDAARAAWTAASNKGYSAGVQDTRELLAAHSAGAQEPVAWMHLKAETFVIGGNDKRPFAKGFVPLYAQPQPMPDAARVALFEDDDERQEFANACDDFAACNETSVDYNLLMKWANSGLLECSHFEVTTAGNAEIERIEREGEA